MDPHLWSELDGPAGDEVAALVRLVPGAPPPPGVCVVARFCDVATIRLARGDLLAVRADPCVVSLKAATNVRPEPAAAAGERGREHSRHTPAVRRSLGPGAPTGRGTVIGVVDWGCDFTHPNLLRASGRTRLLALWDQRPRRGHAPRPYGYGVVHRAAHIDRALEARDPFAALGYDPVDFDADGAGTHGMHVIDIAAGSPQFGPGGVAPGADLVFVHLANPPAGPRGIGSSVSLVEAAHFIAQTAGARPWVINLSLGSHGGPHDGSTLVEQALDAAVTERAGRTIVQSCGNYGLRPIHAQGRLRAGERVTIDWRVDPTDDTENEIEVWYPGSDALAVELIAPNGKRVLHAPPDSHGPIVYGGRTVGRFGHRTHDPNNGDHHASLRMDPLGGGDWRVVLHALTIVSGEYHAWVERDELRPGSQSRLSRVQAVHTTTTGTISNGRHTIAVGAYDPAQRGAASFSSRGPTRDGRAKPDVLARGVDVLAARSAPDDDDGDPYLTRKSGTSMAAPHVTGAVALLYEAAGRALSCEEVRRILTETAKPISGNGQVGYGLLDVRAAVARARNASVAPPAASPLPGTLPPPYEALAEDTTTLTRVVSMPVAPISRVFHGGGIAYAAVDKKQTWTGGQDLAPQITRAILTGLVPPEALTPALVEAATPIVRLGDWGGANVNRRARDKEPIGRFNVLPSLGFVLVSWLELVQNVALIASAEEIGRLERALVVATIWKRDRQVFSDDPWVTDQLLRDYGWRRRGLLDAIHSAIGWKQWREQVLLAIAAKDPKQMPWDPRWTFDQAVRTAIDRFLDGWHRATDPLIAIRDDRSMVSVRGYRSLWKVKEGEQATAKTAVRASEVRLFMNYAELRKPDAARAALEPANAGARRELLEGYARYSKVAHEHDTSAMATGELTALPGLANAPPLPSQLSTAPKVSAPDYFMPVGGELRASMQLRFPNVYEAFRSFGYRWELVRIPQDTIDAAINRGNTLGFATTGEDAPGVWSAIGNQLERRVQYARTDIERVVADLDSTLGPASMGAANIVAMGAIAGFIGEVIMSLVEWLTAKQDEKRIALREPGIYILRCIATPVLLETSDLIRPPSAAYLPLWVRPVNEVADAAAARRLQNWQDLPKAIEEQTKLLADLRKEEAEGKGGPNIKEAIRQEEERLARLKLERGGTVDALLDHTLKTLAAEIAEARTKITRATGAHKRDLQRSVQDVEKLRDDFQERAMNRSRWYGALDPNPPRQEDLVRLRGVLATDDGHISELVADVWRNPKDGDYHVFDSTDTRGGTAHANDPVPLIAVKNALKGLLESEKNGRGRGQCTLYMPTGNGWSGVTFRVDRDSEAAIVQSFEATVQLATSLALIVVAFNPAVGAVLLPLGIVGAIPSAYRIAKRASDSSVGLNLAGAMDLVNLLGSLAGLGQAVTGGLKLMRLSEGLLIMGLGIDGLNGLLLGVDVTSQIIAAQNIQPPAARRAEITRLLGNSLGNMGLARVASMLGRHAEHERAKAAAIDVPPPLDRAARGVNQRFADLVGAPVPVHVDPEKKSAGHTPIHFEKDGYGLPSQIRLVLPEASPKPEAVDAHARQTRTLVGIDQLAGGVRRLTDSLEGLHGRSLPDGSRAGDAAQAIKAAPQKLYDLAEQVAAGKLKPEQADAQLEAMRQSLGQHELALLEIAAGEAFLANRAEAAKRAVAAGYEKPPAGHYVIDGPNGTFALRLRADANGPGRRYDAKTKKLAPIGQAAPKAPVAPRTEPAGDRSVAPPRTPAAGFDPALVQFEAAKILPKPLVARPPVAGQKDVRVKPPQAGGGEYVVTAPAHASHVDVMAAVAKHASLARTRPAHPERGGKDRRVGNRGRSWSGAEEAAYRGYPPAEPGHRWVWRGGEIEHQRSSKKVKALAYDPATDSFGPPKKKETGPPRFAAGDDAMEALGGNDPAGDFGRWVAAVTGESDTLPLLLGHPRGQGLAVPGGQGRVTRDWLRQRIGDPAGRTHAEVREALHKIFRPTLDQALANFQALRKANRKLADKALASGGKPKVDSELARSRLTDEINAERAVVAQERDQIVAVKGEKAWRDQQRGITKRLYNLLERRHGIDLQQLAPAHHRVLYDVQVVGFYMGTFDGQPVHKTVELRDAEHGGVQRTFDNVVYVADATGVVLGAQPHELKSAGAQTGKSVVPASVKGGVHEGDVVGHLRDGATLQKQLQTTQDLRRQASEHQGELVLRGRDALTGEIVEIRVKPERLSAEVISTYHVLPDKAQVPLGADAASAVKKWSEALTDQVVSHHAMLDAAAALGASEGRDLARRWYDRSYAPPDQLPAPTTGRGAGFDALRPLPGSAGATVVPVAGVRVHARPRFNKGDQQRYAAAIGMSRRGVKVAGPRGRAAVQELHQAFLHPEVAVQHANWMADRLIEGDRVSFHVFSRDRGDATWSWREVQRRVEQENLTVNRLADEIRAFASGAAPFTPYSN